MSVSVDLLVKALVTQSSALTESDATASPTALAQQLLYASRYKASMAALSEPAQRRLRILADRNAAGDGTPALFTRWSSFAPQSSLWNFRDGVMALAVASDGSTAYVSVGDGQVFVLALGSGHDRPAELWNGHDRVVSLALSPDDRLLAVGDGSGKLHVILLDPDEPRAKALLGDVVHDAAINKIAWIDPVRLVTAGGDGRLILWHWDDGTSRLLGHREWLSLTSAVPAGDRVFTSDDRGEIWSWSLESAQGSRWGVVGPRPYLAGMTLAPGGSFLYTASPNGVHRWPVHEQESDPVLVGSAGARLWIIAVSPDGATVATADGRGSVLVFDAAGTEQQARLAGTQSRVVTALAWQPSGKLLRGARDGTIVSDWPSTAQADTSTAGYGALWRMAATPDGSTVLVGTDKGLFRTSLTAAAAGDRFDLVSTGSVAELALLHGGAEAAYIIADRFMFWDLESGRPPVALSSVAKNAREVTAMAPVPGHRSVVVTVTLRNKTNEIQLWDIRQTGDRYDVEIRSLGKHHAGYGRAITVSLDGDWVVTSHNGRQVRVWSVTSEFRPRAVGFHRSRVYSLEAMPGNALVVTGDEGGRVAVWSLRDGKMVAELQSVEFNRHVIRDLAVSPDGSWVACVTDRGEVSVWSWPLSAEVAAAKLYPAIPTWRALALNDGLLLGDRRSSLTFVEVAARPPRQPTAQPVDRPSAVVIADQWTTRNTLRRSKAARMNFEALRLWLSADQPCTAIFAAPQFAQLMGPRAAASKAGWSIHDLPDDRRGQVAELARLIRHHSHSHHVIVLTDDPTLSKLVSDEKLDASVVRQPSDAVLVF